MYIEKNCVIEHEGRRSDSGGAVVSEDYLVAYLPSAEGPERVGAIYPLHSWQGEVLGSVVLTGRWRTPNRWASSHMVSGRATVDGKTYNVRGCGFGMVISGRRAKS